jgi:hypothetical protein
VEILQLPAHTSSLSSEYPATELFSSQPDFHLSPKLDRHLFSASLAGLNSTHSLTNQLFHVISLN